MGFGLNLYVLILLLKTIFYAVCNEAWSYPLRKMNIYLYILFKLIP